MLKFIKHNMETILGVEIFPVISFIIFFLFFCILFIWVARMQKSELAAMASMPIAEDDNSAIFSNTKMKSHEQE